MGTTKTYKSHCSLLNVIQLCVYSLIFTIAKSEVITVGGDNRWTDGFDYVSWAKQFNFTVGDILVFSYTKGAHNVYDVDKTTFQSCDPSSGVNAIYESGNDHLELKEAKPYWFICTVDSHCSLGMKVGINVVSGVATNITQTGNSSSEPTSRPNNSASVKHISPGIYTLAAAILSVLVMVA